MLFALAVIAAGCGKGAMRKDAAAADTAQTAAATNIISGTFTDPRDGKTYRTVKIGTQTWMAENLNFETERSRCYYTDSNCTRYGRFYDWYDALEVCPAGWRTPSDKDWDSLALAAGGRRTERGHWESAGKKLKSKNGWNRNDEDNTGGDGTDEFGFSALPCSGVYLNDGTGNDSHWWSATKCAEYRAWSRRMSNNIDDLRRYCYDIGRKFSLRCVADSVATVLAPAGIAEGGAGGVVREDAAAGGTVPIAGTVPAADTVVKTTAAASRGGTFTDPRDGRTYRTVRMGNLTWMAENLNFKTKRAVCAEKDENNCQKYGRLYRWSDAMTACPAGWRAPSDEEWDSLALAAGGRREREDLYGQKYNLYNWDIAGTKLKSATGWADWKDDDGNPVSGGGTDEFGFSALPGGRGEIFNGAGYEGYWWSATDKDTGVAWSRSMYYYDESVRWHNEYVHRHGAAKSLAFSLRCVEDSAGLREDAAAAEIVDTVKPHVPGGGTFTDPRDGKTYRTVRIGNFTWMAENLNFATDSSVCYDNYESGCRKYGRLYDWNDAMTACPAPWRLPGDEEWNDLILAAGGQLVDDEKNKYYWKIAGKKLKSKNGWNRNDEDNTSGNGTDEFGFSALPGGRENYTVFTDGFTDSGLHGYWWSAEGGKQLASFRSMNFNDGFVNQYYSFTTAMYSVRCLKGPAASR